MLEEKHLTGFCFIVCVYLITCNLMLVLNLAILHLLSLLFAFNYFEIFFIHFHLLSLLELMM